METTPPQLSLTEMDAFTLQMFSSKQKFHQVLQHTGSSQAKEIQVFYDKLRKYAPRIKQLFFKHVDCPSTQTTGKVDAAVEECLRVMVKHFDMIEHEMRSARHGYDEEDSSSAEDDDREFRETDDNQLFHTSNNDALQNELLGMPTAYDFPIASSALPAANNYSTKRPRNNRRKNSSQISNPGIYRVQDFFATKPFSSSP